MRENSFPTGYYNLHKNKLYNFQMNRWHSMGYAVLGELQEISPKIDSFDSWEIEMSELAEKALTENRLVNAAFYFRAAEFFIQFDDPKKELYYDKFIELFYRAFRDDKIEKHEIPYGTSNLPAMRLPAQNQSKGTLVIHGGFDSFMEELYSMSKAFADEGYDVIVFDGPGQGSARRKFGQAFDYKWEKPVAAVLDYFACKEVTLLGISMGGWLALRAAAFEPRIKNVIASSVTFDVTQYTNPVAQLFVGILMRKFRKFTNKMIVSKIAKDQAYSWFASNLMFMTDKSVPIEAFEVLLQLDEENLNSSSVKQNVLILTGSKDHMIPLKMHKLQVKALTNANSIKDIIFSEASGAQNHCQVGNLTLALNTMLTWMQET